MGQEPETRFVAIISHSEGGILRPCKPVFFDDEPNTKNLRALMRGYRRVYDCETRIDVFAFEPTTAGRFGAPLTHILEHYPQNS